MWFFFFHFPRHLLQDCVSYLNSGQQNVLPCSGDSHHFLLIFTHMHKKLPLTNQNPCKLKKSHLQILPNYCFSYMHDLDQFYTKIHFRVCVSLKI